MRPQHVLEFYIRFVHSVTPYRNSRPNQQVPHTTTTTIHPSFHSQRPSIDRIASIQLHFEGYLHCPIHKAEIKSVHHGFSSCLRLNGCSGRGPTHLVHLYALVRIRPTPLSHRLHLADEQTQSRRHSSYLLQRILRCWSASRAGSSGLDIIDVGRKLLLAL